MDWFTSDTHFGHAAVIDYCNRPFVASGRYTALECMNEYLIARWNSRVDPEDRVWVLGDFYLGPREGCAPILSRLNGTKLLVKGNHDRSRRRMLEVGFAAVVPQQLLYTDTGTVYMRHKPQNDSGRWLGASTHLHGHVHLEYRRRAQMINVGVDVWNFQPVSLHELLSAPDESGVA